FSFSGLKTSILYFLKKAVQEDPDFIEKNRADICASVQTRIVTILLNKLKTAAEQTGIRQIAIAGGVSANSELRKQVHALGKQENWEVYIPKLEYCTDNAAMIAMTGYFKYLNGDFSGQDVVPVARYG
ncbi:MAG: tRNA (adenosine(37)-N6)-threonylcarbamoyltransferase complex transferase subunit TsaD, partial [Phaeodactylibacter sp.]|nr:tRNA (adenosine(37)-N6)-threonylcarbamoyltransferase complex transferase subunit TsaD [Phaeodactylibacter sp.]